MSRAIELPPCGEASRINQTTCPASWKGERVGNGVGEGVVVGSTEVLKKYRLKHLLYFITFVCFNFVNCFKSCVSISCTYEYESYLWLHINMLSMDSRDFSYQDFRSLKYQ